MAKAKGSPKTGGRQKGSGNKVLVDVKAAAQLHGHAALDALVEIMGGKEQPPAARVAAAKELLDRGFGKAAQLMDLKSSDGSMTPRGLGDFYAGIASTGKASTDA
jgi:hypothetical protein